MMSKKKINAKSWGIVVYDVISEFAYGLFKTILRIFD